MAEYDVWVDLRSFVSDALAELLAAGCVTRLQHRLIMRGRFPVSRPIGSEGNEKYASHQFTTFVDMCNAVGKAGWNKQLAEREQTIEDLKFNNYKKEMFLDSDTKISLISSAPSDIEQDWFLTNEQIAEARQKINDEAGSRRVFAHMIF